MTDERAEIARAACALDETLAGVTANAADSRNDIPPQDMAGDERERRVIVDLAAHLAAAISLLERGGNAAKKAAPSDKMFDQMLTDYRASLERARAALAAAPQPAPAPEDEALAWAVVGEDGLIKHVTGNGRNLARQWAGPSDTIERVVIRLVDAGA